MFFSCTSTMQTGPTPPQPERCDCGARKRVKHANRLQKLPKSGRGLGSKSLEECCRRDAGDAFCSGAMRGTGLRQHPQAKGLPGLSLPPKTKPPQLTKCHRAKNNPIAASKPPLGREISFPGAGWAYFPGTLLGEKEPEQERARSITFWSWSLSIPPGRQATPGITGHAAPASFRERGRRKEGLG